VSSNRKKVYRLPWRSARQIDRDVDEELRFHLDMRVDALVASGVPPHAARARALQEFGDLDDARRYIGAVDHDIEAAQRRSDIMHDLWQDIGYALRKLRAAPAFTLAVVATLALGIGANTAIFSVVDRVLLEPLPFPQPDHIVRVAFTQQGHPDASTPMDLVDNRTRATRFVGFSTLEGATANLVRDGADAERVQGLRVSANFFDLLRAHPLAGRFFAEGEDQRGAQNVAVIAEALWKRDFGASPDVIGKTVRINATPFTIVGIVADQQRYPSVVELWMTKKFAPDELTDDARGARWLGLLGRVKDDVSVEAASAELTRISEVMEKQFPEQFRERRARAVPLQESLTGEIRTPLFVMLGAVGFVLLIACANVANLMLVRATARESELAIRTALGAGRGRLARQLITESVILSVIGGLAGVGVAKLGMIEMLSRAPQNLPLVGTASINATTLVVTAAIALLTGVVFGVLPAAQVRRDDLATALRAGARGTRARPGAHRTKRIIVVTEVALAVTLLSGAGLLLHSFQRLLSVDPGFKPDGTLSLKIALPQRAYDSTATRNFIRALEERARALPGVSNVGIANFIPLDGASYGFSFTIRGRPPLRPSEQPSTEVRQVSPDYFAAIGMPVLRGRGVSIADQPGTPPVLVVNRSFAQRFFPNENPVGHSIALGWGRDTTGDLRQIVGVVGDVRGSALSDAPEPTVYVPIMQAPYENLSIIVRTNRDPASLTTPMRGIVHDLDHEVPIYSVQTMQTRVASSVSSQRFYAMLLATFAGVALALSAVGLYGVIAYAVSQRTHELGVRVALGATSDRISRMVISDGLLLTAIGVVIGGVGSFFAGKLVASLLFEVGAFDPVTAGGVVLVLGLVAALASWLPARRAARVDPLIAMRGD
jgi:predicted permease